MGLKRDILIGIAVFGTILLFISILAGIIIIFTKAVGILLILAAIFMIFILPADIGESMPHEMSKTGIVFGIIMLLIGIALILF